MSDSSFCQYLPPNRKKIRAPSKKVKSKLPKKQAPSFLMVAPTVIQKKPSRKGPVNLTEKREIKSPHQKVNWWKPEETKQTIDAKDYNIFHIDTKIQNMLKSNISTVPELEKDLQKTLKIMQNGNDPTQKILAKKQASLLRKRIQDLESTLELALYLLRTSDMLEEYRTLLRNAGEKSFVYIEQTDSKDADRMNEITQQYMCIAQEYVDIINISQKPQKMACPACQSSRFTVSDEDDSIYICCYCYTEIEIIDDAPSFKDTDRVNMSSKYTYSRKGHFIEAKKRFQGNQNTDPEKIKAAVEVVRREMGLHNLIAEQGKKRSISKDHAYTFLSEQDLSSHYEDLNLIYHIITQEPCPDISMYDTILDELFDEQEEALDQVKEDNRTNSLNVNYKLYKLLQKVGYPCRKDDFYILRTKAKEDEHDEKMKEAWDILGWEWIGT